jgi:hypothetical protein
MRCTEAKRLAARAVTSGREPSSVPGLAEHLAGCAGCARLYGADRSLHAMLSALPRLELPASADRAIDRALRSAAPRGRPRFAPFVAAAAVVSAILVIGAGGLLRAGSRPLDAPAVAQAPVRQSPIEVTVKPDTAPTTPTAEAQTGAPAAARASRATSGGSRVRRGMAAAGRRAQTTPEGPPALRTDRLKPAEIEALFDAPSVSASMEVASMPARFDVPTAGAVSSVPSLPAPHSIPSTCISEVSSR